MSTLACNGIKSMPKFTCEIQGLESLTQDAQELLGWTRTQQGQECSPKQKGYLVSLINTASDNPDAGGPVLELMCPSGVPGHVASKLIDRLKPGHYELFSR